ncbi:heterokaryon incompatibility protein-domain-containing protein [Lasiosphaeris hirsuta]|uniref:Heterokaryon incompatibility protein-domain-containing protein n=1 Tax=Lasiosphaeris hirsuta TaxID=260670 RepID=A0AA40E100_9PEZI|nr:heterokaryon incompatibility protein-domain-containing protein [Lasiosphaeris hirsuta]
MSASAQPISRLPNSDFHLARLGATSQVRVALESFVSFCLNGAGFAVLGSALETLGVTVLSKELGFQGLARSAAWLQLNINVGILESFVLPPRVKANAKVLPPSRITKHELLLLGVARSASFALARFLTRGILGPSLPPARQAIPPSLAVPLNVALIVGIAWLIPSLEFCSCELTLAKTAAFAIAAPFELFAFRTKTVILSTFVRARKASTLSEHKYYNYNPIRDPKTIRLLKLAPSSGGVLSTLDEFALDGTPPYLAVSYLWGSGEHTLDLEISLPIGGIEHIPISTSCAKVLYFLAPAGGESLYLWIDAICINQQDATEKGCQIPLMGDIYRGALQVMCFTGGHTLMPLGDFIGRLVAQLEREESSAARKDFGDQVAMEFKSGWLDRATWIAFASFLENPYWERAWILQEIVLANSLVIVHGNNLISWRQLSYIAQRFKETSSGWKLPDNKQLAYAHTTLSVFSNRYMPAINKLKLVLHEVDAHDRPTIGELVDFLAPLKICASQPRDRIYSLLALCSDAADLAHQPTYDPSVPDWVIFAKATHSSLEKGRINLLLRAGLGYRRSGPALPGLPTWVPDLSTWSDCRVGNWKTDRARSELCRLQHSTSSNLRQLSLRGVRACAIRAVSSLDPSVTAERLAAQTMQDWSELPAIGVHLGVQVHDAARDLAVRYIPECYLGAMGRDEAFWRAMVMDWDTTETPAPSRIEVALEDFVERLRDAGAGRMPRRRSVEVGAGRGEKPWWRHWYHYVFAVTDTGLMGWVPPGTRVGDEVCSWEGCDVPMVVRGQGGPMSFLGTAGSWGWSRPRGEMERGGLSWCDRARSYGSSHGHPGPSRPPLFLPH